MAMVRVAPFFLTHGVVSVNGGALPLRPPAIFPVFTPDYYVTHYNKITHDVKTQISHFAISSNICTDGIGLKQDSGPDDRHNRALPCN